MKTQQNNIWMRYLLLGTISLIIYGCAKKEWMQKGEFYFVNKTSYKIVISDPNKNFEISPNKTFHLSQNQVGQKIVTPEEYEDPITQEVGPRLNVLVKIGDKCINSTKASENSVINIKNYQSEKIDNRTYKFTYTFTEADYNRAVACP